LNTPKTSAWPLAFLYTVLIVYASLHPFTGWRMQGLSPLAFGRTLATVLDLV